MPRQARTKSASNIYHVILRGVNRQAIFDCDADKKHFMTLLKECKEVSGFRLHAFCLMTNHVHLLIEPLEESLDLIFKRIGSRYVVWYNRKYQRAGHLFQDRFRSESIGTDQYYITVLRYILQNPMKAGMESRPGSYRWSSYFAYEKGGGTVTDTQFAEKLFGGHDALIGFICQTNDDDVMDEEQYDWRLRDDQAKEIMKRITQCETASDFQLLDKLSRKAYIREMYLNKMSMGQIARLTGMPKSTVQTAVKGIGSELLAERGKLRLREEPDTDFQVEYKEVW